jgi:hypothetical protein
MHCILHIGTEKTGTTLLQKWLYDNKEALSEQGIALTKSGGKPNNRKLCAYCQNSMDNYFKRHDIYDKEGRQSFFQGFEKEFRSEIESIEKSGNKHVIFTSEHFHSRLTEVSEIEKLKNLLSSMFDDFTVICYFREQSRVRTSLYSTFLKIGETKKIEEFQSEISEDDHYYNYRDFFTKWETVFGKNSLLPRLYEEEKLIQSDIRVDFLLSAIPDVDLSGLSFDIDTENPSLSVEASVLFREMNKSRPHFIGNYRDQTADVFKNMVQTVLPLNPDNRITDPRQAATYNDFNTSNLDFFERFFGERKNLFKEPDPYKNIPHKTETLKTSQVADILSSILSVKSVIKIADQEINLLRDLAVRLHKEGNVTKNEAITLLKLASRARPNGEYIRSKIDELRKEKD